MFCGQLGSNLDLRSSKQGRCPLNHRHVYKKLFFTPKSSESYYSKLKLNLRHKNEEIFVSGFCHLDQMSGHGVAFDVRPFGSKRSSNFFLRQTIKTIPVSKPTSETDVDADADAEIAETDADVNADADSEKAETEPN